MNKQDNITQNFKFYEVFSGDRKLGKNSIEPPEDIRQNLYACIEQLQFVRNIICKPIIITSAYRTPEWNKHEGGTLGSCHLKGLAIDSRAVGMPLFKYYSTLLRYTTFNGYGYYRWKNFIHTDLRNSFLIFKY